MFWQNSVETQTILGAWVVFIFILFIQSVTKWISANVHSNMYVLPVAPIEQSDIIQYVTKYILKQVLCIVQLKTISKCSQQRWL